MSNSVEKLKCALNAHFCSSFTKIMSCGHYVCLKCIPPSWSTNNYRIECRLCRELNRNDFKEINEIIDLKADFRKYADQLAVCVGDDLKQLIDKLNDQICIDEERIEKEVEYSIDEIEIRIESLKIEFDNLYVQLTDELNNIQETLIEISKIQMEEYTRENEMLKKHLEKKASELTVYECEDIRKQLIYKRKILDDNIRFHLSKKTIKFSSIGRVYANDIKQKFRNIDFKEYEILDEPWDLCVLKNDYLLTANYFQSSLTIYDRNFNIIKIIDTIDNFSFKPISIATNGLNRIYISDFMNNRIIMCNYEFELLSTLGEYGRNYRQFNGPSGICYYENFIYVCDYYNERIQKLTSNLNCDRSYSLYLTPFYIKILNSVAAVKSDEGDFLYFYDLPHFSLRLKYDEHAGSIFTFDEKFFQFDYLEMKIYCYDESGKLCDQFQIREIDEIDFDDWTCLTQFDNNLILCPGSALKFIVT